MLDEDCAVLGIDPSSLPDDPEDGETGVWPENVAAVTAFLAIDTQWRVMAGGMGGVVWLGLDYAAARAGLDLAGIAVPPEVWADVQVIEAAALSALNRSNR